MSGRPWTNERLIMNDDGSRVIIALFVLITAFALTAPYLCHLMGWM